MKVMELLVDIGNSRIKWCDRQGLLRTDVASASCGDLQQMLDQQWSRLRGVDSVWVSSVAAAGLVDKLTAWVGQSWGLSPRLARTLPAQLGVVNGYDKPGQLGVDRWLALIGARDLFNRALVIADCGTATTIDAMEQSGRHLGGLILPGLRLMRESLLGQTAIEAIPDSTMLGPWARDTAGGIDAARLLSTVGLVERVAAALRARVGGEVLCVLTGGSAQAIKDILHMNVYHEPNLVLQGLALVARAGES